METQEVEILLKHGHSKLCDELNVSAVFGFKIESGNQLSMTVGDQWIGSYALEHYATIDEALVRVLEDVLKCGFKYLYQKLQGER